MSGQRRPHGPYDTRQEAAVDAAAMVAAVHAVDPGLGPMTDEIRFARLRARIDYITRALTDAGVELGEYDRRIIVWFAEWENETIQTVIGWVQRAHDAGRNGGAPCA